MQHWLSLALPLQYSVIGFVPGGEPEGLRILLNWICVSVYLETAPTCLELSKQRNCRAFDVHVIPYGAVGGLLSSEGEGADDSRPPVLHGQAFCSLPVTPTGLPVHVNGKLQRLG